MRKYVGAMAGKVEDCVNKLDRPCAKVGPPKVALARVTQEERRAGIIIITPKKLFRGIFYLFSNFFNFF